MDFVILYDKSSQDLKSDKNGLISLRLCIDDADCLP